MTKHTHTPGSWLVRCVGTMNDEPAQFEVWANGGCVAIINPPLWEGYCDARLISAAPYMLAALRDMVANYVDTYGDEGDDAPATVKAALAAIAKAEG